MTEDTLKDLAAALGRYNEQFPNDERAIVIRQDGTVSVVSLVGNHAWFESPVARGLNDLLGINAG